MNHESRTWGRAIRSELEPPPSPPTALPTTALADITVSLDNPCLIDGLLPDDGIIGIIGGPGSGKTTLATRACFDIASGRPFFGRRVKQGAVLICGLEGGRGAKHRLAALKQRHKVQKAPLFFSDTTINLLDAGDIERIIITARAIMDSTGLPLRLITLDTLSRSIPGANENDAAVMTGVIRAFDEIRRATGAAIMIIHHVSKGETGKARGHSAFLGALDAELLVKQDGAIRFVTVTKQRDFGPAPAIAFTLSVEVLGLDEYGADVSACCAELASATARPASAADMLTGNARIAHRALVEVVATDGTAGNRGVPPGFHSVTIDAWRAKFYGRVTTQGQARARAFQRATEKLLAAGLAAMNDGRAWLMEKSETHEIGEGEG